MTDPKPISPAPAAADAQPEPAQPAAATTPRAPRPEPTRYGDWELNGKCVDF